MSPKERVRANVYKALLEEEKRRNKKMSIFSVGLFFVGMVTVSTYNLFLDKPNTLNNTSSVASMVQVDKEELISSMYDNNNIVSKKNVELNPDELFIYNTQI
ncbi:hypothetical protein [Fusobacterium massiliense]|jgi:hypothetical protein|uniref:hypothetical protein n=1 Tax=Fusobacterium massiliense TaxID=1852365 RepID=UPI000939BFFF|nr:hypothetical protein [Fusobacterium massiliense]